VRLLPARGSFVGGSAIVAPHMLFGLCGVRFSSSALPYAPFVGIPILLVRPPLESLPRLNLGHLSFFPSPSVLVQHAPSSLPPSTFPPAIKLFYYLDYPPGVTAEALFRFFHFCYKRGSLVSVKSSTVCPAFLPARGALPCRVRIPLLPPGLDPPVAQSWVRRKRQPVL